MVGDSLASCSQFHALGIPPGIRVMLVDDDCTYLTLVKSLLTVLRYKVKIFASANDAWREVDKRNCKVDIYMIDVHLPNSSGLNLIDKVKSKCSDVPVIMCSLNAEQEVLRRVSVENGCFYMTRPATVDSLKNLWEYVEWKNNGKETGEGTSLAKRASCLDGNVPLRQRFYWAVNQLSLPRAVPSQILKMMDVPNLTRRNVACRLQKYRQYLKKVHKEISLYTQMYQPHMHPPFDLIDLDSEERQTPQPAFGASNINRDQLRYSQSPTMTTTVDNGYYSTHVLDFGYGNNSELGNIINHGPDPYTGSSISTSNIAPAGVMTTSWLDENYSSLYCNGAGSIQTTDHHTGFPSGMNNSMLAVPVSGASVGIDTGMPGASVGTETGLPGASVGCNIDTGMSVPGSNTLQINPGVLQPAANSQSSFAFEPNGLIELITEEEAPKLEDILNSEGKYELLKY